MNWRYTTIQHAPRKALGITTLEYCALDIIYKSQTHPKYSFDGWARVGCHKMGKFLGCSSGTILKMYERLEKWGLLEFDETREYKRTTQTWYDVAYIEDPDGKEGVQKLNGVQKVNRGCSKSEQGGVQKVNAKCSKSGPIIKETKLKVKKEDKKAAKAAPSKQSPTKNETTKRKKVAPKKEKEPNLYYLLWEVWAGKHEQLHDETPGKDGKYFKALKSLTEKFRRKIQAKGNEATNELVLESFGLFLDMLAEKGDQWYLDNFTPDIFNSKFDNIINLLKRKGNEPRQQADKYRQAYEELAAEFSAGEAA